MKSLIRLNNFLCILALLLMVASSAFAQGFGVPIFSVKYFVVDEGAVKNFSDYGKSIYSFWPVPETITADGFDVVPLLSAENELGLRWMNLDSVVVNAGTSVTSFVFEKGKMGFSLQNFIRDARYSGTINLFFSAQLEKPAVMNLFVANEGSLPISIRMPAGELELGVGGTDTIPPATKLWVTPKTRVGEVFDSLYVYFSVVFDKDLYRNGGKELYAMPSQSALEALDSLRFVQAVSDSEINLEKPLKKAVKILEDEGFVDIAALSFRLEFFPSAHKRLHTFVFKKDLDSTFYDSSWVEQLAVTSYDTYFPVIYRNGACFEGWSVENRNLGGLLHKTSDFNMNFLKTNEEILDMSPVWNYEGGCKSVAVTQNAEHGHLELLQVVEGDTIVHELKDTLVVPYSKRGIPFIVRAIPDSAFVVEGVIGGWVNVKGNTSLRTRFAPGPDPEPLKVVSSGIEVSGNAVRLRFETGTMNVFRKIGVRVIVASDNGTLLDSMLVDSVETPVYKGEWEFYPAPVGDYNVIVKVFHSRGSANYVDSFTVANELALDSNTWGMISLGSVNLKNVDWNGDQLFYHWDESYGGAEFWQYRRLHKGDAPSPVDGYWYNTQENRPLELVSDTIKKAAFTWVLDSLNSGWNLVANPHGYYVDLNASAAGDSVEFWRWNPESGEYEMPKVLAPYEAVWARVERSVSWRMSGEPVFDKTRWESTVADFRTKALARKASSDGWKFRMVLSDGKGKKDSWNILGAGSKRSVSYEPPVAMGNHVNLSIVQGKDYLARSILQETGTKGSAYEWTLEMDASSARNGFISIEDAETLRASGLRVFLTVDGKTSELKAGDSLKVKLTTASKRVQVRVAREAPKPVSYAFDHLRVHGISGNLTVEFDAGNGFSGKASRLELLDITGKKVKSIDFTAKTGVNIEKIENLRPGLYFVRVKIGRRQLLSKVAIK